jgi:hypothetical protein
MIHIFCLVSLKAAFYEYISSKPLTLISGYLSASVEVGSGHLGVFIER